jgi:hypothetical protein
LHLLIDTEVAGYHNEYILVCGIGKEPWRKLKYSETKEVVIDYMNIR